MASSDEDEDLKKAIALSLSTAEQQHTATDTASRKQSPKSTISSFPGAFDRRAMEKERLARVASRKREREVSPPPTRDSRKAPKLEVTTTTTTLPSGARLNMFSTIVEQDQSARKSSIANAASASLRTGRGNPGIKSEPEDQPKTTLPIGVPGDLLYPNGVVKSTWAFGHQRTGNDVKIEEVLEPSSLRIAVLSAFQWDADWVFSKLKIPPNGGPTRCFFVMQAKEPEFREQMLKETEGKPFLRLIFPPMVGQTNCMHSKLMLLFHPKKLRIAIPTANLLSFDWGETGMMENSVFMIDLPRFPDEGRTERENLTQFGKELYYFMEKQEFDQKIMDGILKFDFTKTAGIAFVHTIGGVSYKQSAERTGLPGLAKAVRDLDLKTKDLEIDFAASSIGSLNVELLRHLQAAAQGEDMVARAAGAVTAQKNEFFRKSSERQAPVIHTKPVGDQVRIYFPTKETVRASTAGSAGTICLNRKWFENTPFPRACFRDYRSVRKGLLSHNKILYARGKRAVQAEGDSEKKPSDVAWAYVGSANMSESAWGKLSQDKKSGDWKTICRNWECGVLLPVPVAKIKQIEDEKLAVKKEEQLGEKQPKIKKEKVDGEDSETESEDSETESESDGDAMEVIGMNAFEGLVDPPFEIPGELYGDREPWYFLEVQR
ncbi:Hypothetical protein R9X50_00261100 [Acrodontium crateriforme]|uniref:Phospholipase D/nuclease n=1 Tax=Acrodontium crateriforme TaxID=150365 RepID=A0AAQ3M1V3_9PEZI|nr:Hypothetical protein R9X50_00261100 [Acrodontium crateriforme]